MTIEQAIRETVSEARGLLPLADPNGSTLLYYARVVDPGTTRWKIGITSTEFRHRKASFRASSLGPLLVTQIAGWRSSHTVCVLLESILQVHFADEIGRGVPFHGQFECFRRDVLGLDVGARDEREETAALLTEARRLLGSLERRWMRSDPPFTHRMLTIRDAISETKAAINTLTARLG